MHTPQTYILPGDEVLALITEEMRRWLGPASRYCNHLPLVDSTLGYMLHGQALCPANTATDIIAGYGIPYEAATKIADRIEARLETLLYRVLGEEFPDYNYIWDLSPMGDITLSVTPAPTPLSHCREESYLESIRRGVANGDWYPSHLRSLAGC